MAKKVVSFLLIISLLCFAGCKKNRSGISEPISKIALITGTSDLELDFNNGAVWEGIATCGDTNSIEYTYYQPESASVESITAKFEEAAKDGAKVIVSMGDIFAPIVAEQQTKHSDIKYVLIDVSGNTVGKLEDNTHCVMFREEQSGYLAGYGAVKDGFTKFGFMGERNSETYSPYCYGLVQGANDAATEFDKTVEINVAYCDEFGSESASENEEASLKQIQDWYTAGTEIVMVVANDAFTERCAQLAVNEFSYMIGANNDQSYLTSTFDYNPFMTSAMKGLREAVDATLEMMLAGNWDSMLGGQTVFYGLQNGNYVYLPDDEALWLFKDFSLEDYSNVKDSLSSGAISVSSQDYPKIEEERVTLNILSEDNE